MSLVASIYGLPPRVLPSIHATEGGVPGLARLSPERVWSELKRILATPDPRCAVALMMKLGVLPAVLTGAALAFARGIGEYGSVIFIAGNRPGLSEVVPLLIVIRLEGFDTPGAALLGAAMLVLSAALLLLIHGLDRWGRAR